MDRKTEWSELCPRQKVIIMGAAGRDFHNFNTFFRKNPAYEVVAFTATQIPDIEGRRYPPELSGELYPKGIPIHEEQALPRLIKDLGVDFVVFAYSDVSYEYVMHRVSLVNAVGASFMLLGGSAVTLESTKPVIAVCAVRTGCGKSQTSRRIIDILQAAGKKVVAVRHPMPYGDLAKQRVQRYAELSDLEDHDCTIEEMEEYEPHIAAGNLIYAGVDYEAILREAEKEADIIIWDGGNNDTSFYRADLTVVVTDPFRAGNELSYYPGETNLRLADVIVINKLGAVPPEKLALLRENIRATNPTAVVVEAASPIFVDDPAVITGKRVLVIEDGPTLTHGGMKFGAGTAAAERFGAAEFVDPRRWAVGSIAETFEKYPGIGVLLPAMGYGPAQVKDLEATIKGMVKDKAIDSVIVGTPINLKRLIEIGCPATRVSYELQEIGRPTLEDVLRDRALI
ncbi:MAG: cyclic 2,3-diphosphoglycerate synthase [bacterium]|nr:cyclic 2,3-diphosphoglycerate synthase [bacterium]